MADADAAAEAVLNNPYLCMEIANWHPMVYSRLMLVSRRFKDWIDGKQEIVAYDRSAKQFKHKIVDMSHFKRKYMESWVETRYFFGYESRFKHQISKKLQSVNDRPAMTYESIGRTTLQTWYKNGLQWRDGDKPTHLGNWPTMISYNPEFYSHKIYGRGELNSVYRNGKPFFIEIKYAEKRLEKYYQTETHHVEVHFMIVDGRWKPYIILCRRNSNQCTLWVLTHADAAFQSQVRGPALEEDETE